MIGIFVQSADAFGVDDQDVDGVAVGLLAFNGRAPDPEALGAGVDGGSDSEALLTIQDHTVHEVAFAGSVKTDHGHHGDRTGNLTDDVEGFLIHLIVCLKGYFVFLSRNKSAR